MRSKGHRGSRPRCTRTIASSLLLSVNSLHNVRLYLNVLFAGLVYCHMSLTHFKPSGFRICLRRWFHVVCACVLLRLSFPAVLQQQTWQSVCIDRACCTAKKQLHIVKDFCGFWPEYRWFARLLQVWRRSCWTWLKIVYDFVSNTLNNSQNTTIDVENCWDV